MADTVVYLCRECGAMFEMPTGASPRWCARCGAGSAYLRTPATELPQLSPDIRALAIALVGVVGVLASPAVGVLVMFVLPSFVPAPVAVAIGFAVSVGLAVAILRGVIKQGRVR